MTLRGAFTENEVFSPPPPYSSLPSMSRAITVHFSFDMATWPMYFLTPRKCAIFGVCCEGIPRQVRAYPFTAPISELCIHPPIYLRLITSLTRLRRPGRGLTPSSVFSTTSWRPMHSEKATSNSMRTIAAAKTRTGIHTKVCGPNYTEHYQTSLHKPQVHDAVSCVAGACWPQQSYHHLLPCCGPHQVCSRLVLWASEAKVSEVQGGLLG